MKWLIKNKGLLLLVFLLFANWLILRSILAPDLFFPAHDSTWLIRLQQFDKAVSFGQFPPRLAPDMAYGYGYPLFKYYAPLFTLLSWLVFKLVGDYALAVGLTIFLSNLVGSLGMFYLGRKIWGFWGGVIASVSFTFLPFRALEIYVRGAFSESLAINLLPFWFYFLISIIRNKPGKRSTSGFIFFSLALLLAHNLYLIVLACCLPVLAGYFLITARPLKKKLLVILSLSILALLLSSWFWLPMIIGLKDINVFAEAGKTSFSDHFIYLEQLWNWNWGFGGSAPGLADGMSFKVGKLQLILAFLGLIFGLRLARKRNELAVFLTIFLISLFFSLSVSSFFWEKLPFLAIVQFPWRFLGLLTLVIALFSGGLVALEFIRSPIRIWLTVAVVVLATFLLAYFNLKYFAPQSVVKKARDYYLGREKVYQSAQNVAEYYPARVVNPPEAKPDRPLLPASDQSAQVVLETPFKLIFRLDEPGEIAVNRFYFPGWRLVSDEKAVEIKAEEKSGRILFSAPWAGEYQLSFASTLEEKIAYALTALGAIILAIFLFY
jgi:hypothetical protein